LIEDYAEKLNVKKNLKKLRKPKFVWRCFNEAEFVSTNTRVVEYKKEREILERLGSLKTRSWKMLKALIEELEIVCPESGSRNWTEVRQFNLMFGTKLEHLQIPRWICICVQKPHRNILLIS
jgi:glycyl-tRNA synthetase